MSTRHKRPRSLSPPPPPSWSHSSQVPDACWYFATGTCSRVSCPFSHRSYRDLLVAFTNKHAFVDNEWSRKLWARCDHFDPYFAQSPLHSTQQSEQWTAVLPVPLIAYGWDAFHHPLFASTMTAVMGRAESTNEQTATVSVLMGERKGIEGMKRLWGGVLLQGRREQVERGREGFIALMEQNYYRRGDVRVLHSLIRESPPPVNAETVSLRANNGEVTSTAAATTTAPHNLNAVHVTSPAHKLTQPAPCVQQLIRGRCSRLTDCSLLHEPYPVVFARLASTAVTSRPARELSPVTHRFSPQLAPLASSLPHSSYVVSLPLPCVPTYSAALMGEKALHARFIPPYCGLHYCEFTHGLVPRAEQERLGGKGEAGQRWLAVNGEGIALCVDRLLECVFTLVDKVRIGHWLSSTETVEQLRHYLNDWERRRERAQLSEGEFFAFQSRSIPFRVQQPVAASFPSSAAPTSALPPISPVSPASSASGITDIPSPTSTDISSATMGLLPLSPLAAAPASLPLSESESMNVAARLAIQLADMLTAGHTVTYDVMDAMFDEHCLAASPQSVPFIRLLPTGQFACLPLPLDELSRALLICESFDALAIPADIEAETGVDLYVPPLPGDVGIDNSSMSVLCNVQFSVAEVSEQSNQQLEEAVLRMMMRWEAVQQCVAKRRALDNAHTNGLH